ncbi:membrane-associated ring finger 5 [Capsaspora owczarzaki ATCC 30864]|uniref:Membrane-associated ring finger 5 n=1 Tax=Capsaspora owczarzaki (strain ATCC 30864) TaxID=595528 RepID=A0A0D2WJL1_CAPO3|nr:membrane-associated ring finger 5 [Capsaspora owczarzaki ATCC 30864]KJE89558.1 membrane-associated ring finger 5 [Capsaspora owczarzaki ATCC 30864]|eukprot:XP_004365874.2 membrane-associated ring finger 5 [Capsaspora owczarzaki ATCC 30864]
MAETLVVRVDGRQPRVCWVCLETDSDDDDDDNDQRITRQRSTSRSSAGQGERQAVLPPTTATRSATAQDTQDASSSSSSHHYRHDDEDEDEDEDISHWVRPCKCSGATQWVHQACIRRWVDLKVAEGAPLRCPQCLTPYNVTQPEEGTVMLVLETVDQFIGAVSPFAALGICTGAIYVSSLAYGAFSVCLMMGFDEGIDFLSKLKTRYLCSFIPLIPVSLMATQAQSHLHTHTHHHHEHTHGNAVEVPAPVVARRGGGAAQARRRNAPPAVPPAAAAAAAVGNRRPPPQQPATQQRPSPPNSTSTTPSSVSGAASSSGASFVHTEPSTDHTEAGPFSPIITDDSWDTPSTSGQGVVIPHEDSTVDAPVPPNLQAMVEDPHVEDPDAIIAADFDEAEAAELEEMMDTAFEAASLSRTFVGAMLLPAISGILGRTVFRFVSSNNLTRSLLGGVVFLSVKSGIHALYRRQRRFIQQNRLVQNHF